MLIQAITPVNFSSQHKRTDIGPLNHDKHRGILLHPTIAITPERLCLGIIDFELPTRNKNEQRRVKQAIHVRKVRLSSPDRKRKRTKYQIVETQVVIATEINAPSNQTSLEWILLINVPIDNVIDAQKIVKWYLCRWQKFLLQIIYF